MSCCHAYLAEPGHEQAFTVDASRITFGRGCIAELGTRARAQGMKRVALFTDRNVRPLPLLEAALRSLHEAGCEVVVFDEVRVEPTDRSLALAIAFARETVADGYVSVGGGSVIDTCKAANLYATYPAELLIYVNAPVGGGVAVPGALRPHIACPTTSGTGSEVTGIAVFDLVSLRAKTAVASPRLRPSEALVDPDATDSLPGEVVASSGFDVLSHALESYTARPFTARSQPDPQRPRPMSQGRNPWSDVGCREALELLGRHLSRAVHDASDREARQQVMWAATLAGIAFGNAGVHLPHAMSYAVAGLAHEHVPAGYAGSDPMVPHGVSVIVNAPAVFRHTSTVSPELHLEAARWLGGEARGAAPADAGEVLTRTLIDLMRALGMPNGVGGVGLGEGDLPALVAGASPQRRLLDNAPLAVDDARLLDLFRDALSYW